MSRITIAPIVEGYGDEAAVRILLQRVWQELLSGEHAEVLRPIRRSRGRFLQEEGNDLERSVNLAMNKLGQEGGGLILILVDAEEDCERMGPLGPLLLGRAHRARNDADIAVIIANVMWETWFVAAADSLGAYLDLNDEAAPTDPEGHHLGKGWIKQRMRGGKYSETVDQAALTARMDLTLCRQRSPSFDKLCRELEGRCQQ
jgi:hypothetical protein